MNRRLPNIFVSSLAILALLGIFLAPVSSRIRFAPGPVTSPNQIYASVYGTIHSPLSPNSLPDGVGVARNILSSSLKSQSRSSAVVVPTRLIATPEGPFVLLRFTPARTSPRVHLSYYLVQSLPASARHVCHATPCTITALKPTTYRFRLVGVTNQGYLPPSGYSNKVTLVARPSLVRFSPNGASGSIPALTLQPHSATYLPLAPFNRPGYSFAGWSTTPAGGTDYAPGAVYLANKPATLYAQWLANSTATAIYVALNANGGTTTTPTITYSPASAGLLLPQPTSLTGSAFIGWFTSPTDPNTLVYSPYAPTASQVLYAHYSDGTFPYAASSNWSGYENVVSQGASGVSGSWLVPTITCSNSTQNSYLADWVGLGGGATLNGQYVSTGDLLQTGSLSYCSATNTPVTVLWWELAPTLMIQTFSINANPGDQINAAISKLASGSYQTIVTDQTTGLSGVSDLGADYGLASTDATIYSIEGNSNGLSYSTPTSVEWIAEAPTQQSSSGSALTPLVPFSPTTFYNLAYESPLTGPVVPTPATLPESASLALYQGTAIVASPSALFTYLGSPAFTVTYSVPPPPV